MQNKKIFLSVLTGACLTMAMTMPSCPGQQAMQQQVDSLQTSQQDMVAKMRGLETQVKTATTSTDDQKKMMGEMSAAIAAQKSAIDNLNATVQQLDAKVAALGAPKSAKGFAKPTGKHRH